jgi:uncharacterized protein (DUF2141 family)
MLRILIILIVIPGWLSAQDIKGKVIVEVTNLETSEGQILLSVYDSDVGFPGDEDEAVMKMIIEIGEKECQAEFELPPGIYAISLAHDINNNMEVDTNFLGIPKEPLGMSNYPDMARPKFDKAKFELKAGEVIKLEIPVNTIF